ncbi:MULTISPECIES: thioredoxin [Kocuria]|nr:MULTISPECIES: thioredoxin [unclassified Kocuria]
MERMATVEITQENLQETITGNDIVLLDWWADWCGPCKQFAPTFESASEKNPEIVFGKVDTEDQQALAASAQISSIPTLMAFREGILVFSQAGALPESALDQVVEAVKNLDMDEVRKQVAEQQAGEAQQ